MALRHFLQTGLLTLALPLGVAASASSDAAADSSPWRSALYPENWSPGFRDSAGRFLHDFSQAGYQRGEKPIPDIAGPVIDVTTPPYSADPTGRFNATASIQSALDDAGRQGGGVVFLPAGTYRVAPPEGRESALLLRDSQVVLRGAGAGRTFIFNDEVEMRGKIGKRVISVEPRNPVSWHADGKPVGGVKLVHDQPLPVSRFEVENVAAFSVGDTIVVRNDLTQHYIDLLGLTDKWKPAESPNRTLLYCRTIVAVDPATRVLTVDIPLRGFLYTADNARVLKVSGRMLAEVGLEDFSIGMKQHPGEGLTEEDNSKPGTAGYAVHSSVAIHLSYVENGWVRRVATYAPKGNAPEVHVLSNCLKLWRSRLVTVADCDLRHAQYKGGGGNGYLYTHQGQDNLVRDCRAEGGRHNYDFGTMAASGNVIFDCVSKDGKLASDFHMFLSLANLLDNVTCDGDFLEARAYRPWGGNPVHGVTTTQSVFWNTKGLRYPSQKLGPAPALVYSHQFGDGYVIGTRGPASAVDSDDFVEGVGRGESLIPRSLYLDQLARRLAAHP